jgi:hypothetical protein
MEVEQSSKSLTKRALETCVSRALFVEMKVIRNPAFFEGRSYSTVKRWLCSLLRTTYRPAIRPGGSCK